MGEYPTLSLSEDDYMSEKGNDMSLNPAQMKAITHKSGPCMVLAGPGSGKTTVITKRTEYLIKKHRVKPEEILVITF